MRWSRFHASVITIINLFRNTSSVLPRGIAAPHDSRLFTTRRHPTLASSNSHRQTLGAGYDSSAVATIQLESFKVFHRLSFGHRNPRTYVIVVYDPASRACRAMETEVRTCLGPQIIHRGALA